MRRIVVACVLCLLGAVSCLKSGSYKTVYVLKPSVQVQSVDPAAPLEGVLAYAYAVDTAEWGIASYEDAVVGILSRKSNPSEQLTEPAATAIPYVPSAATDGAEFEAEAGSGVSTLHWLQMALDDRPHMVVAVDPSNRLYGYTMHQPPLNIARLYISVVFQPWKEGRAYKNGNWSFYNDFFAPPTVLKAYFRPTWQAEEEGEEAQFASSDLKVYAFVADTTDWQIASYDDAVAGRIVRKTGSEERTTPNFQAYHESDTDLYGMEVTATPLLAVVVDRLNRLYAYTKLVPDLTGESPTWPVVFRPWMARWKYDENGWVMVDESLAPQQ